MSENFSLDSSVFLYIFASGVKNTRTEGSLCTNLANGSQRVFQSRASAIYGNEDDY